MWVSIWHLVLGPDKVKNKPGARSHKWYIEKLGSPERWVTAYIAACF